MTPTAKTLTFLGKIHEQLNDFMSSLLAVNGGRIVIKSEVLLEEPKYDDNIPSKIYVPYFIKEICLEDGKINVYQQEIDQSVDFGKFDIAEKENLIFAATKMAENEARMEYFPITSVARADVENAGFDTTDVTDEQMEALAEKMGESYVPNNFWEDLDYFAVDMGFKKKPRTDDFENEE